MWARLKRSTGDVRPALAKAPDTTLDEMVERLREERSVTVVRPAVWKLLDRHGQTHKKRLRMPASKSALM